MFSKFPQLHLILASNEVAFRKPVSNHLFLMYCLLGGMYYEQKVDPKIRIVWLLYNMSLFITVITGSLWYLFLGSQDVALVLSSILNSLISVYATVVLPLFMYCFRADLMEIIEMVDQQADQNAAARNSNTIVAFQSVVMLTLAFTNFAYTVLFYEDALLKDPFNYVFLIPFTQHIDSMLLYVAIYSVQIFLALAGLLIPVLFPLFLLIITAEIRGRIVNLCLQLRQLSGSLAEKIEFLYFEGSECGTFAAADVTRDLNECCDAYVLQLQVFIRRYRQILYFAGKFKPFMDFYVSISILVLAGIQLVPAYIVIGTNAPLNVKVKEGAMLLCIDGLLFVCCIVGRTFNEINELVTQEVYSTPWYYFPARHRKFVHILLCQVSYPLRIFAMRILPVSMDVFPKMIRILYSYINFLHSAVTKK